MTDGKDASTSKWARLPPGVLALLPPLLTLCVQWAGWRFVEPYAWVLLYPAMFVGAWIGGLRSGLVATLLSTALVWLLFVPPAWSLGKEPRQLVPAAAFLCTGIIFVAFHERLRRTSRRAADALEASRRANERLTQTANERRIFAALVDNSSDFIGIADSSGTPVYVNPAGRRMVGLAPDQPVEETQIPDYYPPTLRAFASDVILKSMLETGHWKGETRFRHWQTQADIPVSDSHFMIREPRTGELLGMGTVTRDISDLHRAQERLDLALRGADLGAWDWDIPSGAVAFNPRWAEMRGYRLEDIRQHVDTWTAGVHPDDWSGVQRALTDHFQGVLPEYETEHRVRTRTGEWIWILDRGKVFARDEQGRPTRMVGTELDVTQRKRAESALRLSEAKYAGIVSVSVDAIISVDEAQRITMFNEGAERIFGYTRAEAVGAPLDMLLPARLRAVHRAHVERFADGPETARRMGERSTPIVGLRKDGGEFPADAAISKLEVAGQRILTVSLRDITEQRRLEDEQRFLAEVGPALASTLEYDETLANVARLVLRDLADVCVMDIPADDVDLRRSVFVCSDSSGAWACEALERLRLDPTRPLLLRPVQEVLETRRPVLMERAGPEALASSAPDEEQLRPLRALEPRSALAVPLLMHGDLVGALTLLSSRPGRTYVPADVRLVEQLAQRAVLALENARLYRASQRAIQARNGVLGIVAHDLRNPLNIIALQARLLRGSGSERAQATERIGRAAARMSSIIQDLLDVTRMDAGTATLDRRRISPGQVVCDAVEAQEPLAASVALELQLDVALDLPEVWADRDRLLRVFENLLSNAIKFTTPGGRITVGAVAEAGEVQFSVADTGVGISAAVLPRVFDRFWQADPGERRGAGLGLAIVKGIVEAHGGRIWVESQVGRGTTFRFTVPVASTAQAEATAPEPSQRRSPGQHERHPAP